MSVMNTSKQPTTVLVRKSSRDIEIVPFKTAEGPLVLTFPNAAAAVEFQATGDDLAIYKPKSFSVGMLIKMLVQAHNAGVEVSLMYDKGDFVIWDFVGLAKKYGYHIPVDGEPDNAVGPGQHRVYNLPGDRFRLN